MSPEPSTPEPSTPPQRVLDAVAVAYRSYEWLEADAMHLHFRLQTGRRKVVVEMQDLSGRVLSTVSVGQVVAMATAGLDD